MNGRKYFLLLGLGACASVSHSFSQNPASGQASSRGGGRTETYSSSGAKARLTVSARIDVLDPVGIRTLKPGDKLYSGENFTITTWTDQPAYLYVVGYEPNAWSTLLFPREAHLEILGDTSIRLPLAGRPYIANNNVGEFSIKVYASAKPLTQTDCTVLRLRCPLWSSAESRGSVRSMGSDGQEATQSGKNPPPPPPPPPPPDGTKRDERDVVLSNDAAGYVLSAKAGADGTARMTFTLMHAAL